MRFLILGILLVSLILPCLTQAQNVEPIYYPDSWKQGGVVEINSDWVMDNYDMAVTVNVNDGTTALIEINPDGETQTVDITYAVIGRLLKINRRLTPLFEQSRWYQEGYLYDGNTGTLWYPPVNGLRAPRTTFTPLFMANLWVFYSQAGFGGLEGFSRIAVVKALIRDPLSENITTEGLNSDYSIHRVPQDSGDQEILLREPGLIEANIAGHPIPDAEGRNRSTGCVNYDASTWIRMEARMQSVLDEGGRIIVIFSIPEFPQDSLLRDNFRYSLDPMSHVNVSPEFEDNWGYGDVRDQRGYSTPSSEPSYPTFGD